MQIANAPVAQPETPDRWVTLCFGVLMGCFLNGTSVWNAIAKGYWLEAAASTLVTLAAIGWMHKAVVAMQVAMAHDENPAKGLDHPQRSKRLLAVALAWSVVVAVLFALPTLWTPVIFANCFPWMS